MDYRYLKVFLTASQCLNFSQTGKKLGIAPSAVTRQIQLFETSVGEPLFIRNNRQVRLTEKGREIYKAAQNLEGLGAKPSKKMIRIGGLSSAIQSQLWAGPQLKSLLANYDLAVKESPSGEALRQLELGHLDFAFVNQETGSSLITFRRIKSEKFVLISSEKISRHQLARRTWIFGETGELLKKLTGLDQPVSRIQTNSLTRIYELVERGLGVAVVPEGPELGNYRFHKIDLDLKGKSIYLAMPQYEFQPEWLKEWIRYLSR